MNNTISPTAAGTKTAAIQYSKLQQINNNNDDDEQTKTTNNKTTLPSLTATTATTNLEFVVQVETIPVYVLMLRDFREWVVTNSRCIAIVCAICFGMILYVMIIFLYVQYPDIMKPIFIACGILAGIYAIFYICRSVYNKWVDYRQELEHRRVVRTQVRVDTTPSKLVGRLF
jgi:hypothetical protein